MDYRRWVDLCQTTYNLLIKKRSYKHGHEHFYASINAGLAQVKSTEIHSRKCVALIMRALCWHSHQAWIRAKRSWFLPSFCKPLHLTHVRTSIKVTKAETEPPCGVIMEKSKRFGIAYLSLQGWHHTFEQTTVRSVSQDHLLKLLAVMNRIGWNFLVDSRI